MAEELGGRTIPFLWTGRRCTVARRTPSLFSPRWVLRSPVRVRAVLLAALMVAVFVPSQRRRTPSSAPRSRPRSLAARCRGLQRDDDLEAGSATRPWCASPRTAASSWPPRRARLRVRQHRDPTPTVSPTCPPSPRLLGPRTARASRSTPAVHDRPSLRVRPLRLRQGAGLDPAAALGATAARRRPARPPTAA